MSYYFQNREWMDRHIDPSTNNVSREFSEGVDVFYRLFLKSKFFFGTKNHVMSLCNMWKPKAT